MTAAALRKQLQGLLADAGADNPYGESVMILEHLLGINRLQMTLGGDLEVSSEMCERAAAMAERRASGVPIQYVLGSWTFMGREYCVGEGVLIPRDDTEVVVRAAEELMRKVPSPAVADLCSGSGIIAVTLYHGLNDPTVSAVEKSAEAFAYLSRNCESNSADIRLIHADLRDCTGEFPDGSLDLLISNPPYVRRCDIAGLQSEVQFEPAMALDGGESGYDFYEAIISLWSQKLKSGGVIAFELGEGQFGTVSRMLTDRGFSDVRGYPDIQDITRAVTAIRNY